MFSGHFVRLRAGRIECVLTQLRREFFENIGAGFDQFGTLTNQAMTTACHGIVNRTGDGKHLAPHFAGQARGN